MWRHHRLGIFHSSLHLLCHSRQHVSCPHWPPLMCLSSKLISVCKVLHRQFWGNIVRTTSSHLTLQMYDVPDLLYLSINESILPKLSFHSVLISFSFLSLPFYNQLRFSGLRLKCISWDYDTVPWEVPCSSSHLSWQAAASIRSEGRNVRSTVYFGAGRPFLVILYQI